MDPLQSAQLVVKAVVAGVAGLGGQLGQAGITKDTQAVVESHPDHAVAGPDRFVEHLIPAGTAQECTAVDVDDDRRIFGVIRGPDVQILAVLTVGVVQPLAELTVVELVAPVLPLGGDGVFLHGAGTEFTCVVDSVPMGHLPGIFPPARLCIADALISGHAGRFGRDAPNVSAGRAAQVVEKGQAGGSADRGNTGNCSDGCGSTQRR